MSSSLETNPESVCLFVGTVVISYLYLLWQKRQSECIYLDYNGTTPIYPFVVEAMMPYFTNHWGNPSSSHAHGREPRQALNRARRQILKLLSEDDGLSTDDEMAQSIWFTSCGTESDNFAIQLALQCHRNLFTGTNNNNNKKPNIVTCNVEHPAVDAYLKMLECEDHVCTVTRVPVQTDGRVLAQDMIAACRKGETILVTLMLANNETGALQPVREVAEYCRSHGILFHTDAAQAAGKISIHLKSALGDADMVSIVGHKLGAPKGVACLYVRPQCWSENGRSLNVNHGILLVGAGQEFGSRSGTQNVPLIVGFGAAAERAALEYQKNALHMEQMRSRLWTALERELGSITRIQANGPSDPHHRLPNTLSVAIPGVHSGTLLAQVGNRVAASAGATCHSGAQDKVSSVLQAMQIPTDLARGTLRLSVGPSTRPQDIDRAALILAQQVREQLQTQPNILRL